MVNLYFERKSVIRYRNYDESTEPLDFKREMAILFLPFNYENDVHVHYIEVYNENERIIMERRKEYQNNLDIEKTMEAIRNLIVENDDNEKNIHGVVSKSDPHQKIADDPESNVNFDILASTVSKVEAIAKKRENIMEKSRYVDLVRNCNSKQKEIFLHLIHHIDTQSESSAPHFLYLGGYAGCGKTYTVNLIKETYNRYSITVGHNDAFLACGSTGKSVVAIGGQTLHSIFSLQKGRKDPSISCEKIFAYRTLMKHKKFL